MSLHDKIHPVNSYKDTEPGFSSNLSLLSTVNSILVDNKYNIFPAYIRNNVELYHPDLVRLFVRLSKTTQQPD